jgi:hypothetical protein
MQELMAEYLSNVHHLFFQVVAPDISDLHHFAIWGFESPRALVFSGALL